MVTKLGTFTTNKESFYCRTCDKDSDSYTIRWTRIVCTTCFSPLEESGVLTIWGFLSFGEEE